MRRDIKAAALLLAVAASGCGKPGKPEAVPAGGKVAFRKSTPPVGALVVFHPSDAAREKQIGGKAFGKVGEDGTFQLTTYAEGDGAPEGEYGVTVDWRGKPGGKMSLGLGDGGGASGGPLLKPKYSDPKQPAFKVTVRKGEANAFTFEVD